MPKTLRTPAHHALRSLLTERRTALDLTQAQLASRLHRPQSFVAKYEKGERRLDVIEFCAIARALSVEPAMLLRELVESADL